MKKIAVLIISFFSFSLVYSNTNEPFYIEVGTGAGTGLFRDLATSPLFYGGKIFVFSGGVIKKSTEKETNVILRYGFGDHTNNYNNTYNTATLYNFDIIFSHLYLLPALSSHTLKPFAGVTVLSSTNIRNNTALMNNSFGVENISNIMISGKVSLQIPRKKQKFKLLQRAISTTLSAGLINLNYRPGYAYNYLPTITDTRVRNLTEHSLSLNGFRINAQTDYTTYLSNGNGVKISYIFDAYNAPGRHEPFSHSRHTIQFTLLFKFR